MFAIESISINALLLIISTLIHIDCMLTPEEISLKYTKTDLKKLIILTVTLKALLQAGINCV